MKRVLLITGFALLAVGGSPAVSQQSEWWSDDNGVCRHALRRAEPDCSYLEVIDSDGVLGTCSCSRPVKTEGRVVDAALDEPESDVDTDGSASLAASVESAPVAAAAAAVRCRQIVVNGRRYQICR